MGTRAVPAPLPLQEWDPFSTTALQPHLTTAAVAQGTQLNGTPRVPGLRRQLWQALHGHLLPHTW